MIRRLIPVAVAAAVAASAQAETRSVEAAAFSKLEAVNGVAVDVSLGAPPSVVIEGPESQIDDVVVEVDGDLLRIHPEQRGWFNRVRVDDVVVRVTAPSLTALAAENGAEVKITGVAADVQLALRASNGGMIEADGACDEASVSVARGGMVDASALACRAVTVEASMGGLADVNAAETLEARASMGGQVSYAGAVQDVSSSMSMGGFVGRDD